MKSVYINVSGIVIWIKMYVKGLKLTLLEPICTKILDVSLNTFHIKNLQNQQNDSQHYILSSTLYF